MARFSSGVFGIFARAALVAAAAVVGGCGSGAVSAPPTPVTLDPISITPNTATVYSDTPSTFIISGGNGNYIVTSSDQAAVPIAGAFTGGNALTIVPNPVSADTPVTLTVRDTASSAPVSASLTVKPRTVSNVVTVTPSTADCTSAVCSGSDAEVVVKLSLNGLPLVNRTVRFDVVSGNFAIITSAPGLPEATSLSGMAITDSTGTARVRVRVAVDAPSQTGLLQVTDVGSGSTQRVSFLIAQNTGSSAGFFVTPQQVKFTGPNTQECSGGTSADIYVFGGLPPYTVSNSFPQFFSVSTTVVSNAGGRFTITTQGRCIENGNVTVRDSAGRTATVTLSNALGTRAATPLAVTPTSLTFADCTSQAQASIVGGTGNYTVTSGNGAITVISGGSLINVRRTPNTTFIGSAQIGISDGQSTTQLNVQVNGPQPGGQCPP